jgi:hypothetical protein
MKWQIEYLDKEGVVSACASGQTTMEEHLKFTQEAVECARKNNTHKIFIDFKKMLPDLNILQIDQLPKLLIEAGVTPKDKLAVLFDFSSPLNKNFVFFGNVTALKSLLVKPFSEKEKALAWLKQGARENSPQKSTK